MGKKKISKGVKIGIIIASVVFGLFFGYIAYAYVVSNMIDGCNELNDYCRGVWPFNTTYDCDPNGLCPAKPIIYLYPKNTTEVSVELGEPEKLSVSYPLYENGWRVLAQPDGKLIDLDTDRELYSLYWEGKDANFRAGDEGFIVRGEDAIEFLEEKLAILGLNDREAEEFIVYWLPKMQENQYNYVRFASTTEIDNYMPLKVTPAPDTIIRINMVLKGLDRPIEVREQLLEKAPERNGFTVVEWGGSPLAK